MYIRTYNWELVFNLDVLRIDQCKKDFVNDDQKMPKNFLYWFN